MFGRAEYHWSRLQNTNSSCLIKIGCKRFCGWMRWMADSIRRRICVIISPVTLATLVGHLRGHQNYFFNIFLRSFWNAKHVETANGNSKADAGNCRELRLANSIDESSNPRMKQLPAIIVILMATIAVCLPLFASDDFDSLKPHPNNPTAPQSLGSSSSHRQSSHTSQFLPMQRHSVPHASRLMALDQLSAPFQASNKSSALLDSLHALL